MFARDPRHLQFEADVNRLFLYTRFANIQRKSRSGFPLFIVVISFYEVLCFLPVIGGELKLAHQHLQFCVLGFFQAFACQFVSFK
jgi:hypothetical protein